MMKIKQFLKISGQMKDLFRNGWVYRDVNAPESDAAHSWSLSLLVQMYAPAELDLCKCLKLANIHDLAEIYVGDFVPGSDITPEEKHQLESEAMVKLAEELDYPELTGLFDEYEAAETPEAVFVRNMDKLDAVLQAKYYDETQNYGGKLFEEFYSHAATIITHPLVRGLLEELRD